MQPTFTTIQEARRWASLFLQKQQREPRVADLLLEHFLSWSPSQLLAFDDKPMPADVERDFVRAVRKHADTGVPVQHLTGVGHFYGREFQVNEDVLIPRPETEELVLGVVNYVREKNLKASKIIDLGTGSGVIAITLAAELTGSDVTGVDLSRQALEIAEKNATQHGVTIRFHQGNFLESLLAEPFDIIISNPPYIAYSEKDQMDDTVVDFDPAMALFAEDEGLAAYKTILSQISHMKRKPKCIAFEIGHQQGGSVSTLIHALLPEFHTEVRQDINGKDRMVFAFFGEEMED